MLDINNKNWASMLGLSITFFQKNDLIKSKDYFSLAVKEEPRLKEGIDCLVKFEKEGYFFSDKEKEILLNIFNKYNDN